jgi:hypothetical protein
VAPSKTFGQPQHLVSAPSCLESSFDSHFFKLLLIRQGPAAPAAARPAAFLPVGQQQLDFPLVGFVGNLCLP